MGQFASAQNSCPQICLLGNTNQNTKQVNVVGIRSGLKLEMLAPKKKALEVVRENIAGKWAEQKSHGESNPHNVKPPPPFPQKFKKKKKDELFGKFIDLLKHVHINLPLIDIVQGIPKYASYVKDIMVNESRLAEYETVAFIEKCNSQIQINYLPS